MRRLYFVCILLLYCFSTHAQGVLNERVYVHLDKECYVAGEKLLVKFYVTDANFRPSGISKVGYVEICNTQRPYMQLKLALDKGAGAGEVIVPPDAPSGIYQLKGYTRYMMNEGEEVFFQRQIAIVNMGVHSDSDQITLVGPDKKYPQSPDSETPNIITATDQKKYPKRSMVNLSLDYLPGNITDLVVSVSRNDSITYIPAVDKKEWIRQVSASSSEITDWKWLPEYEGHIIIGRPEFSGPDKGMSSLGSYSSGIGFVGKDIRYIQGQKRDNGLVYFYTGDIYGPQEIVTSVYANTEAEFHMQLISPFSESVPESLPALRLCAEDTKLMDRFVNVQLQQIVGIDSLGRKVPLEKYYYFRNPTTYDLDEYTRFNTLSETFIEFVHPVIVRKSGEKRVLKVLQADEKRFSAGNTLVLLDGAPICDHEDILSYNPRNIRTINVYDGRYQFGHELYECMISFVTHRENLPSIQLNEASQLQVYNCPSLPVGFQAPEYVDGENVKTLTPDFRHTLYWDPLLERSVNGKQTADLSFYTSDMTGEFKVVVEGFTGDGKVIYGSTSFQVTE